jgi:hypothetical protein
LRDREERIDQREFDAKSEPSEPLEPTDNTDRTDPTDPTDKTEPIEPTDRNEPREAIDSTEAFDHSDHFEADGSCPFTPRLSHLCGQTWSPCSRQTAGRDHGHAACVIDPPVVDQDRGVDLVAPRARCGTLRDRGAIEEG